MADWKIVPRVLTAEMMSAWQDAALDCEDEWRWMLAAAPRASEDEALLRKMHELLVENDREGRSYKDCARAVLKMLEGSDEAT